ncbi:MAG: NTE family protein [Gammaproteobacteria bacterium]|nr:MAG: NTE family protein [Gammaproteobacteria bacterium]
MFWGSKDTPAPKTGLVLGGGGARAAYQVGVLRAVAKLLPRNSPNPFPIVCGASAGAINAAALAVYATRFREGVFQIHRVWSNFQSQHVFRSDARGIALSGLHWLSAMMLGGLGEHNPHALLDRAPLRKLLTELLSFDEIQNSIDAGALHALSITASGYNSGQSVTFFQGVDALRPWQRVRRCGVRSRITLDHLLASSAIPFVFRAIKVNREFFGDGSMRHIEPIGTALQLGADRVFVIGVRQETDDVAPRERVMNYPSMALIAGHVLNSIFLDNIAIDMERRDLINKAVAMIPSRHIDDSDLTLRPVEVLMISPSEDIGKIAQRHAHRLPLPVRYLLRGVGAPNRGGSNLLSYLLFEKEYCEELMALGYKDTMDRKAEVLTFLGVNGGETPA